MARAALYRRHVSQTITLKQTNGLFFCFPFFMDRFFLVLVLFPPVPT
jgi:hypothetical protein